MTDLVSRRSDRVASASRRPGGTVNIMTPRQGHFNTNDSPPIEVVLLRAPDGGQKRNARRVSLALLAFSVHRRSGMRTRAQVNGFSSRASLPSRTLTVWVRGRTASGAVRVFIAH